uniref:hypothetical protein n=1 Tax=Brevibacillus agri TaxID=51101 RepID=UPI0028680249
DEIGMMYVFDRGYVDYEKFDEYTDKGVCQDFCVNVKTMLHMSGLTWSHWRAMIFTPLFSVVRHIALSFHLIHFLR